MANVPNRTKQNKVTRPAKLLSVAGEPPTEFRLFSLGTIRTENGTFFLDEQDMRACIEAQATYGNDLSIDYEHGAFTANGEPRRAAGWIGGLEARPDGLWAVRVTWTMLASEMIRNREQRYYSPAFETDDAGHIRKVVNCALTIIPASHGLLPLVAKRKGKIQKMAKFIPADAIGVIVDRIKALADSTDSEPLKELAATLSDIAGQAVDSEDIADGGADDAAEGDALPKPAAASSEQAGDAEIAKLARSVTGKENPSEVRGVLLAMGQGRGQATELLSRITDLETKLRKRDVDEVVRLGVKAGKLRPAQRDWATKLGMGDLESLRAFVAEAPVVITTSQAATQPVETEAARVKQAPLSADEEKILRLTRTDRDAYLQSRTGASASKG